MRSFKHIIGAITLLLFLSVWMGSCSSSNDEPYNFDGDLSLVLNVSVLEPGSSPSRGSRTDFEQPELDTEKLQTLRVIIVEHSSKDEAIPNDINKTVKYNNYIKLVNPGNSYSDLRYKVEFSTNYSIYLIGNELGLPQDVQDALKAISTESPYTDNTIEDLVVSSSVVASPFIDNMGKGDAATPIPMSEKFNIKTIDRPNTHGPQSSSWTMEKDLFLTRCFSKFTFNLNTSKDYIGTNQVDIKSIKISGLGTKEYLIPNTTSYNPDKDQTGNEPDGGREIIDFVVPEGDAIGEYVFKLPENVTLFPQPNTLNTNSYSPELYFMESLGNEGEDKFQCTISFDGETYLPPVTLNNLPSLPRNTHVIVNITVNNNNSLVVSVEVIPWEPEYIEIDFTHNIAMAEDGALSFTEGTYASLDKTQGRLVLNDYPNAVTGEFGISQPEGARWNAYLITTSGELNVIQFQVTAPDGTTTYTNSIGGIIDGKKTTFKVAASQSAGNQMRTALLQVIVTTLDGLSIPVNVLKSTEYGENIENITFVQNPNN